VSDGTAGGQVVGIDLHLHRSVIARIDGQGTELGWVRIDNDPKALVAECRKAGRGAAVAIEATYGWYWAVDALLVAVIIDPSDHRPMQMQIDSDNLPTSDTVAHGGLPSLMSRKQPQFPAVLTGSGRPRPAMASAVTVLLGPLMAISEADVAALGDMSPRHFGSPLLSRS